MFGRKNRDLHGSRQARELKAMKKDCSVLIAFAFVAGMSVTAMAASVGGTVASSQGQPLTGIQVIAKDASGHLVGQGAPGSGGRYVITGLQPATSTFPPTPRAPASLV